MDRKQAAEHYARNAALGRTVRFTLTLDGQHLTDVDHARVPGMTRSRLDVKYGTLTPEQGARLLAIVLEGTDTSADTSEGSPRDLKPRTKGGES